MFWHRCLAYLLQCPHLLLLPSSSPLQVRDHFENNAEAKALLKQVGTWVLLCAWAAGWAAVLGLCAGRAPSGPPLHMPLSCCAGY